MTRMGSSKCAIIPQNTIVTDGLAETIELCAWTARELPIRFFGDVALRTVCAPVVQHEFESTSVQRIADDLIDVLTKYRHHSGLGRGLAANQIGYFKRIIAVWFDDEIKIMCNLTAVDKNGWGSYWESCISSGTMLIGEVHRAWTATFRHDDLHVIDCALTKNKQGFYCINRPS